MPKCEVIFAWALSQKISMVFPGSHHNLRVVKKLTPLRNSIESHILSRRRFLIIWIAENPYFRWKYLSAGLTSELDNLVSTRIIGRSSTTMRLSENRNFFQNQGLRKKLPQAYGWYSKDNFLSITQSLGKRAFSDSLLGISQGKKREELHIVFGQYFVD